jgi:membrane-associated phospholipid phosphatase
LPLRDADMIWIDRHLGFDWIQIMRGFDHQRLLLSLMDGAYATFTAQLIGTVLLLIAFRSTRELDRFFVTFICASVFAELASVLAPTVGPMLALAHNDSFLHLHTLGRATGQIVLGLRSGSVRVIDLNAIDGIISFPSLHAAVAVIVPYTLRWNKPLFWPILVLNCVMLASAIPSGNHYLADVLGGIVVAVFAILCGERVQHLASMVIKQAAKASALAAQWISPPVEEPSVGTGSPIRRTAVTTLRS